ncbi:Putative lipid carrier protein [plant metagenome]|uniref:Lipid carrier protein n=1 Tax=plant metagenome TaxID=1297885 RepID=A0A484UNW9_9ZZZZ
MNPSFTPPAWLAKVGRRLPCGLVSLHAVAGLELARTLAGLAPPAELNGHAYAITVSDLGLRHVFRCEEGRFRPVFQAGSDVSLSLTAALSDFIALGQGAIDADTLFFQRRLMISGDTELGLIVKNWLDASQRPAWLARLFGQA